MQRLSGCPFSFFLCENTICLCRQERKRVMMEILPFLTSPMGCDLPMSLVLSCSPSLVLQICSSDHQSLVSSANYYNGHNSVNIIGKSASQPNPNPPHFFFDPMWQQQHRKMGRKGRDIILIRLKSNPLSNKRWS